MAFTKEQLAQLVVDYANAYVIDPAIALAQIKQESSFNPNAVGPDGERGLSQFLPATWNRFSQGVGFDLAFDPDYNLTAWGNYMSFLLNRYGYDYEKALQAYNGGEGNVDRGTVPSGARNYSRKILSAAGVTTVPQGSSSGPGTSPSSANQPEDDSSFSATPIILIAAVAIAVLLIKRD